MPDKCESRAGLTLVMGIQATGYSSTLKMDVETLITPSLTDPSFGRAGLAWVGL